MKLRLALMAVLATSSITAQAETPRRQQALPQQAAAALPPAPSGWTVPMTGFAQGFNETASRLNVEIRAVEKDCNDRGTPVRTCAWQIGTYVSAVGGMGDDRSSPKDWQLGVDQAAGAPAAAELMAAMTVMLSYMEPTAGQAERRSALVALFPPSRQMTDTATEARLRETQFSVLILPRIRILAGIRRPETPQQAAASPIAARPSR